MGAFETHGSARDTSQWPLPADLQDVRAAKANSIPPVDMPWIPKEIYGLTQRLFIARSSGQPRVVAFTGADWSAASRSVCASIARALALQTEMSVCFVDVNVQTPDLPGTLSTVPGLAETLLQPSHLKKAVRHISGSLWKLSSNRSTSETLSLLTSARFRELMSAIRSEFRYALVACPPIVSEPSSIPMCAAADTTVLVIGSKSKRAAAAEAARLLKSMGISLAGAVLGQLQP